MNSRAMGAVASDVSPPRATRCAMRLSMSSIGAVQCSSSKSATVWSANALGGGPPLGLGEGGVEHHALTL